MHVHVVRDIVNAVGPMVCCVTPVLVALQCADDVDALASGVGLCCTSAGQFKSFGTSCGADSYCGFGQCNPHHGDCAKLTFTMKCNSNGVIKAHVNTDKVCSANDWAVVSSWGGDSDCQRGCVQTHTILQCVARSIATAVLPCALGLGPCVTCSGMNMNAHMYGRRAGRKGACLMCVC